MSKELTPAELREQKAEAAHDNQAKAEKEFAAKLPKGSDAAEGQTAAPVEGGKSGSSFNKEDREKPVGEVEYYSAGTAGDQADPERVFESANPANRPQNNVDPKEQKAAAKAASDTKQEVDKSNPFGQADKKFEGNSDEAKAKKENTGAAKTSAQDDKDGSKADNKAE